MSDEAKIYLTTPEVFEPEVLAPRLDAALATRTVACVRLTLASTDEAAWRAAAEKLREVTEAHDVALVVNGHYRLVQPLGLDGVHLPDGRVPLRTVREELGAKRIVGAFAGTSRHNGMVLAEAGADYVSFGPVGDPGTLGDGTRAERELFEWWAQMIETPLVAEGALGREEAAALSGLADFIVPEPGIWDEPDIAEALRSYAEAFS